MSGVRVTVIVQVGDGKSSQVIREHRKPSCGDVRFSAVYVEQALADAAHSALSRVVAVHGDVRDDPRMHLLESEKARPLTGSQGG